MVILFWSFARWGFIEKDITYVDNHHEEFQSDYDILVVMKDNFAEKRSCTNTKRTYRTMVSTSFMSRVNMSMILCYRSNK